MIELLPLSTVPAPEIEALLDRAFGPDRFARTAYRVRGTAAAIPALSFAAVEDGRLIGSIQCWPVALTGDDGRVAPMVMVGPVAVDPVRQRDGLGRRLVAASLDAAAQHPSGQAMMLIGDPEYYGRFFGFTADATARWRLPGPVEAHRLLARGSAVPAGAGTLGPALVPAG